MTTESNGILWFRCRGCGLPACYFTRSQGQTPAGAVGHSKPVELIGVPNAVDCALYLNSRPSQFWRMHERDERIAAPVSMTEQEL